MPTVVDATKKQIVVDLNANTTALVIRSGESVTIVKIRVNGKIASGDVGSLVLRKNSVSGPIVYTLDGDAGGADLRISDNADFEGLAQVAATGLYLDALTNTWAAGSKMVIHVTRGF